MVHLVTEVHAQPVGGKLLCVHPGYQKGLTLIYSEAPASCKDVHVACDDCMKCSFAVFPSSPLLGSW